MVNRLFSFVSHTFTQHKQAMPPPKHNESLITRIAVEAQLLAEEKWIIDALKKIKKQRNCLQIEKLHLEHLKSQLKGTGDQKGRLEPGHASPATSQCTALDIMQNPSSLHIVFEVPRLGLDEDTCNIEGLNLAVTDSVFKNTEPGSCETEEEEEDIENCLIDMNMLMYSKPSKACSLADKSD